MTANNGLHYTWNALDLYLKARRVEDALREFEEQLRLDQEGKCAALIQKIKKALQH